MDHLRFSLEHLKFCPFVSTHQDITFYFNTWENSNTKKNWNRKNLGCLKLSEKGQIMSLKELKEQLNPEMVNDVRDGDNQLNPANKVNFCLYYTETGQRVGKAFLFLPENQSQLINGYD